MAQPSPRPDGPRRVALIGYGAIGRTVAETLAAEPGRGIVLAGVLTRQRPEGLAAPWCADLTALLAQRPELVVEVAGDAAFAAHVPDCLAAGVDVLSVSAAALAVPRVAEAVTEAMAQGGGRLRIASGAIGALDALSAAAELGLDEVRLVQRKPPAAFADVPPGATAERVMSDGSARAAALAFPRNSNIAAAVALAGIGLDATRVQVVMDPAVTSNQAELIASGPFGALRLSIQNRPSPRNPGTATLVALSVLAALRPGGFALNPKIGRPFPASAADEDLT